MDVGSKSKEDKQEITEDEKLRLMRSFLHTHHPPSKDVGDDILQRFLHLRKMDVDKASNCLLKYLKWREELVPNGSISELDIQNELAHNKCFLQGFDKKGRPIGVLFFSRHVPSKGKENLDELKRLTVYALDKICSRMPTGEEQFVCIGDLKGWGYSNYDINGCITILSIIQEYFPERLGQLYVVHEPYIFKAVWKFINPFIRSNTKKKFVFVESKKVTSRLLEDIDESQLPDVYGGKLALVPVQDS